jgi:hypothetical protein
MRAAPSHHAEWLNLVEISGPFVSLPVLDRVFPQGLDSPDAAVVKRLALAYGEWAEETDDPRGNDAIHRQWVRMVLGELLELPGEVLLEGSSVPSNLSVSIAEHRLNLAADWVVHDPVEAPGMRKPRLLVKLWPRPQRLDGPVSGDRWSATPAERMVALCRGAGVRLGLVTNGQEWMLVDAPVGETPGLVSWQANLWFDERLTLRAFYSLFGAKRFFGVAEQDSLEQMLVDSVQYQAEVTGQLGTQVRRAVEVLIQALDKADADTGRTLLKAIPETRLYEAALAVMMRLVFLFSAEERGLLLLGDQVYDQNYAVSTLAGLLREEADRHGIEVLERRQDAYGRLLATFRAIYGGVDHEELHLLAYGGSLFDPDRYPFLEGRDQGTSWTETDAEPLPIDNRTVLHLLEALQLLQMRGRSGIEARKLSFRALDIEQIGHVYEGLLDHTALRATAPVLGLVGPLGEEAEVGLDRLEELSGQGRVAVIDFLKDQTRKSRPALENLLDKPADPIWAARLADACASDEDLVARVMPFQALVRDDPWGDPIVIRGGSVFVSAGLERRSTGTHYTPRVLTEEIVQHTLEPLVYRGPAEGEPREEWVLRSPSEILDLKVCDPAMGSGAFLVQACRYLADRLIEARQIEASGADASSPASAFIGTTALDGLVASSTEDLEIQARRLVAERCLYGVDLNPIAVEMAKLSMWLVTLGKGRPFGFLDHAFKSGDSLLGVVDLDQIRYLHPDPERGRELHHSLFDVTEPIRLAVDEAIALRQELESFLVIDVVDAERKRALDTRARAAVHRLRLIGDFVCGAAISTAEGSSRDTDARLLSVADALRRQLEQVGPAVDESLWTRAHAWLNAGNPPFRDDRRAFHWAVEFPEVFQGERAGFDAVCMNPPFLGGKRITGPLGTNYREYLVDSIARGKRGNADLSAYFLLRASALCGASGGVGSLATNTIAQGDTREVGTEQLLLLGWRVTRATSSRPWPGQAGLEVSVVWLTRAEWEGAITLNGMLVSEIDSRLQVPGRCVTEPRCLKENRRLAVVGTYVMGEGFLLQPSDAAELLSQEPRNAEILFPYLSGDDITSSPDQSPSRWVINFGLRDEEEARRYPECWSIVEARVKPQRQRLDPGKYASLIARWWQFARPQIELRGRLNSLERVLVAAQTSKYLSVSVQPTSVVCSHLTVVFLLPLPALWGVLASGVHEAWIRRQCATLETRLRYIPGDGFETFPLPSPTPRLDEAARSYLRTRAEIMRNRQQGLTSLLNCVHNPADRSQDLVGLREVLSSLDSEVALAYGWSDLSDGLGFIQTERGARFTRLPTIEAEIIDRLMELNVLRQSLPAVSAPWIDAANWTDAGHEGNREGQLW